ncbi:MAG: hypothetical protein HZC49_14295 [Nitrospirae bacterium]|nr:hypothetical protein [Nitrospirota bacterium]
MNKKMKDNGNIMAFVRYENPRTTPNIINVNRFMEPVRIRSNIPEARNTKAATHISGVATETVIKISEDQMNRE